MNYQVSALYFSDLIVMSLSKGSVKENTHVQRGCQREHEQSGPSFAFSAQSTAGFPALPGKRDIVAMAIPEAGSSPILEVLCVSRQRMGRGVAKR